MVKSGRLWFGVAVSLLFLALFLYKVDWREAVESLRQANYLYVAPAIIVYFGSVYFRTLRWQYLLWPLKSLKVGRLYPVVVVGYMANNLLPVRLGEVVRSYYLSLREGVSASASLATIVVERVFDGLALLALAAVVSLALPVLGVVQGLAQQANFSTLLLALGVPLLFSGVAASLILAASFPGLALKMALRAVTILPSPLAKRLQPLAQRFLEGLVQLRSPRKVLGVFLLSMPIWLAEATMYLILAYAFQLQTAFDGHLELAAVILLVTAVSNLATSLPSSPGGVGPFEFFAKGTLVVLGVGAALATAYVGVLHVVLLVPVTVVGLLALRSGNLTLGGLRRQVESRPRPEHKGPTPEVR